MNYEKKYKEALNWMKDVYPTLEGAAKEDAEHYFPELKESRDERIKEDIIWCLKHSGIKPDKPINPHVRTTMKEALAWLEKKGEQKISFSLPTEGEFPYNNPADTLDGEIENIWEKLSCDNKFTATKDGFHEVVVHFVNWYEKQGEQKNAWSEDDESIALSIEQVMNCASLLNIVPEKADKIRTWLKSLKERVKPKQKQELNEDTQQWIDAIIKDYEEWYKVNKDHRATIQIEIDILKSLKERVGCELNCTTTREWSEEDKGYLLEVKCVIDEVWHNKKVREEIGYSCEELETLWHWLDNIWQKVDYPQDQWKPSYEQMSTFWDAICNLNQDGYKWIDDMKSLYQDLNKLNR